MYVLICNLYDIDSNIPSHCNLVMAIMEPHGYVDDVEKISSLLNGMRMATEVESIEIYQSAQDYYHPVYQALRSSRSSQDPSTEMMYWRSSR